jgi:tRNA pseudouridine38-40 synthase
MAAHFEVPHSEFKMSTRKLGLALNAWLPEDVRVVSAARAHKEFHARFDATGKQYRYFVWNHSAMNPLIRRTAWHVTRPLDLAAMRMASQFISGAARLPIVHSERSLRA